MVAPSNLQEIPTAQRFNVKVSGRGDVPMMFAHGFGCDQSMWRFVAPAFADDYRLISFDYLGHGDADTRSYSSARYQSLSAYAEDVLAICRDQRVEHGVFVGHSVSAMIGALAAVREPHRFDRIVMIGPSPCYLNDGDYRGGFDRTDIDGLLETVENNFVGWANGMAPVIMGNTDRPELGAELAASFCRTTEEVARDFARVTFLSDNRRDLAAVPARCLVLQCADDVIAPVNVGRYVHDHLPRSEFEQLAATGHCPHVSAPEETIAAMRRFLDSA